MILRRWSGRSKDDSSNAETRLTSLFSISYTACMVATLTLWSSMAVLPQEPAASAAHWTQTDPAASSIFRKVVENQKRTDQAMEQFERIERTEIRRVGSAAATPEVKVYRVFPAGMGMDKLPLSADGKPGNTQIYIAELEKLEKALVWSAQRGVAQEEAYAKLERKRKERNDLLDATHEAFVFTRVGEELRGDRKLVKYTLEPNPSYKPTTRTTMVFPKVRGTVWIDEATSELARIEGVVTEDISIALFVARVYKGSHFMQERYEVEPDVWLPSFQQYDFDGRKFFVPISIHERTFFTNYKRVGPPGEAVATVRAELGKLKGSPADP
jgi:hypothetical protein